MTYRQIHVDIWDDPWFLELDAEGKLLFIYLFSNKRTNVIGLYEIARKAIAFESGLPLEIIERLLDEFAEMGKIHTIDSWVWVPKLLTRNTNNLRSPKTQAHIAKTLQAIPDTCPLKEQWIDYYNGIIAPQYGIDTVSMGHQTGKIPSVTATATATVSGSVTAAASGEDGIDGTGSAIETFIKVRGGAVNPVDIDQIMDLVNEFEQFRASLPRASPGADVPGDGWVHAAILEGNASRKDGRMVHLNYIKAILDRWRTEGYQAKFKQDGIVTNENGRTVITVDS